ncbi:MAG: hypothetical protein Q8L24_00660, partial [bacterium]|nr:hypothetical protein [bacterium]
MEIKSALNFARKGFFSLLILSLIFAPFPPIAYANSSAPKILGYQGRLTNASGDLLGGSGTTYYFKFSIWSASTDGSQLWPVGDPSSVSATVRQGVFTVNIGDTANGYPDALNFDFTTTDTPYLQIEASTASGSGFETLTPRPLISSSAFSQISSAVSGISTPSSFGTTTPTDYAQLTIEASSTTAIPLSIRASSGQTANLFQIQEANDGINQIVVDSKYRFGLGTTTIGGDLGAFGLGVEGAAIVGNFLNASYINATSTTATST